MKGNTKFKKCLGIVIAVLLLGVIYPLLNGASEDGNNTSGNGVLQVGQDAGDSPAGQAVGDSPAGQPDEAVGGGATGQPSQVDGGGATGQPSQVDGGGATGQPSQVDGGGATDQPGQGVIDEAPDLSGTENYYTFRSEKYLTEHFEKHGSEFDYASKEEYEAGANRVIASEEALRKTEAEDGDYIYYLESSNEIVFLSTDGYIRTYFKPWDGIGYYERQ